MEAPKISVISVVFNAPDRLEHTIKSVLAQDYASVEYLVIDGGSDPATLEVIERYKRNIDFWVSEPDDGIFDAMNKGIRASTGTWLSFMNAGDLFVNDTTLSSIDWGAFSDTAVIYGSTLCNALLKKPLPITMLEHGEIFACHQSMFFNNPLLGREMYYDSKLKIYADYELLNRIYLQGNSLSYVDQLICHFEGGGVSSETSWRKRLDRYSTLFRYYGIPGVTRGIMHRLRQGF